MKALDLFCCCGGAAMGLHNAGFEVTGVDITNNHQYPFEFIHSDVFQLEPEFFNQFDLIWASPPCQAYSWGTLKYRYNGKEYPDLVHATRQLLTDTGKPFIIENVVGAPVRRDLILCGEMFGLRVIRHRVFETHGFTALQPLHESHKNRLYDGSAIGVFQGGYNPGWFGNPGRHKHKMQQYTTVAGHNSGSLAMWQDAMGIDWITKKQHLAQAVPPKYSEYIARYV